MIDIANDDLLTLRQATAHVPGRPHISTVFRWMASDKLESVKVGGKRFTSRAAIHKFIENCTGRKLSSHPTQKRKAQISEAERELARDGIA